MSLIFDQFPTRERAEAFVAAMAERHARKAKVFDSQEAMEARVDEMLQGGGVVEGHETEWFPGQLEAPIALVSRFSLHDDAESELREEAEIKTLVEQFGGTFVGT
jgi:hypothetical protein